MHQQANCARVQPIPLVILVVLAISLLAGGRCLAEKPSLILIVADDLGYGDVGCYGSQINSTPHIDALAAAGVRFTDFHSAGPSCSPTRAAMLTGQYQQRFGRKFDSALSGVNHRQQGLPHEAFTIAELLRENGYATACFGKWHLGYLPPWLPTSQGFDLFRGLGSGGGDHHTHIDRWGNQDWWHNNSIKMEKGYTTQLLTKYSLKFIEDHRAEPFFLYVPHQAIHFPWQGPDDPPHRIQGRNYRDDKWGIIPNPGDVSPHVKAMVESVDRSVGHIVDALRRWRIEKNTVVIFTSDNGGYLTYGENSKNISSNGALRGQKAQLYEGGHRVPTIVSWPGRIDPSDTDETGHSIDLLPTLAGLAGIARDEFETDGVDLGPLLSRGESMPDRMLFWRARSQRAVRSGPWKLYHDGKQTELYNLDHDLGEQCNLADDEPDLVKRLSAAWTKWEAGVNASAQRLSQPHSPTEGRQIGETGSRSNGPKEAVEAPREWNEF